MKSLFVALSFAVASIAAHAGEATLFDDHGISTKSRAEVRAEVLDARAAGTLISGEVTRFVDEVGQPRTRAQVRMEAQDALASGKVFYGEAPLFM